MTAQNIPLSQPTEVRQGTLGIFFLPFSWSLAKGCTLHFGLKPASGELWVFTVGCSGISCYDKYLGVIDRAQIASDIVSKKKHLKLLF